ncbi:MAG: hypothetical protein AAF085_07920 [Planctomycetota bacterium]
MKKTHEESLSPTQWWARRLPLYNGLLLFAGVIAYVCYLGAIDLFRPDLANDPEFDPGGAAVLLQACGYAFMMIVANICYQIFGPGLESLVNPTNTQIYRRVCFYLGAGFSCLLPFAIPVLVALDGP